MIKDIIISSKELEFTPLEFETTFHRKHLCYFFVLEFTPLEFETLKSKRHKGLKNGLEFTPLEFETR